MSTKASPWTKSDGDVGRLALRPISSPLMVGRDDELFRLVDLAHRPPSVALVEGQAGVGKSRLVAELAAHPRLADRQLLVGRCHHLQEPFLLGPFVDAVRGLRADDVPPLSPLGAALRPLLPELAERLPASDSPELSPDVARHVTLRAMAELLGSLGPTVCILEDLHWSDAGSEELVRWLVEDLPATLTLVLTYRAEDLVASPALVGIGSRVSPHTTTARIVLEPLDRAGVGALCSAILGEDQVAQPLVDVIHRRTGGLPFAVEELLRLAQDQKVLTQGPGGVSLLDVEALGVPPAVRDSVLERVHALGPDGRRVVEAAAVLAFPAGERLLARVASMTAPRVTASLCQALRAGILVETGPDAYALRHPLAAEAVADAIPPPERRRLHRRAARELEVVDPPPFTRLAHHCREAGQTRRWRVYAEAGAEMAMARGDSHAAVRFLNDALGNPTLSPADRARLAIKLGWAALASGLVGQREALHHLRAVADDETLPATTRADARLLVGDLLGWAGDIEAARRSLRSCLSLLEPPSAKKVRVIADLASGPHLRLPLEERLEWLARADADARLLGDPALTLDVLAARACVLLHFGDPAGWQLAGGLPAQPSAGDVDRLVWLWLRLASACVYLGYYERAEAFLHSIHGAAHAAPERVLAGCRSLGLVLRWVRGDWAGLASAARAHARATTDTVSSAVVANHVAGLAALATGHLDDAETTLADCMERAEPACLARSLAVAAAGVGRVRLVRGDPETAWKVTSRAVEAVTAQGTWIWAAEVMPTAVEAALTCGRREEADRLVRTYAAAVADRDAPVARAAGALCWGLLLDAAGEGRRAAARFAESTRIWAALPYPYEEARAALRLGQCLLADGDEEGRTIVAGSIERLETLGASFDADQARDAVGVVEPAGDVRGPRRRGRRSYGEELSPREQEVAELASGGLTYTEIGHALHISARTAEGHVRAVMRKLGLSNKRALITGADQPDEDGER